MFRDDSPIEDVPAVEAAAAAAVEPPTSRASIIVEIMMLIFKVGMLVDSVEYQSSAIKLFVLIDTGLC